MPCRWKRPGCRVSSFSSFVEPLILERAHHIAQRQQQDLQGRDALLTIDHFTSRNGFSATGLANHDGSEKVLALRSVLLLTLAASALNSVKASISRGQVFRAEESDRAVSRTLQLRWNSGIIYCLLFSEKDTARDLSGLGENALEENIVGY